MRYETQLTSISWIPSEAVRGTMRVPFELGLSHYDDPPPEHLEDLDALREADRFRFANRLSAWIEVEDGEITGHGCEGFGLIGSTTLKVGPLSTTFDAMPLPDIEPEPEVGDGWVRFTRTAGGRTGVPTPRRVWKPPFIKVSAPLAWTTLSLTLHADGRTETELAGASPFPRHWIFDGSGALCAKSGLIEFKRWYRGAFGRYSPWGKQDSPAVVGELETALERALSLQLMRGGEQPDIRTVDKGEAFIRQGEESDDVFLVLDGIVRVDVDGNKLADLGPGAVLGERAVLEGGRRTATNTALTACRLAVARPDQLDRDHLVALSEGHKREEEA